MFIFIALMVVAYIASYSLAIVLIYQYLAERKENRRK